ncbi:MAG: ribonuclease H-like domain-containing protein [Candidatus Magasanikbacteria bacterium]|nr:ribonuclease H-like domain-containing protein [Candidatus Magasanikbacteria bacterium]
MSNEIIFDIETIGDITDLSTMEITVVSIYEYEHNTYSSFERSELSKLWPILEKCSLLIGYNSEHFDIPILNRYYPGDLTTFPSLDLLKVIKDSIGRRLRLNDVAEATLDITKSADGLQAMKWWKEGKIDEIKKYCEQDVKVTKEVYEFGKNNKQLFYKSLTGEVLPFAVNFDFGNPGKENANAKKNINLTLPF